MALITLPRQLTVDINGEPRVGAKLYVYDAGTNNTRAVYTTKAFSVTLAQPIQSTEGGIFPAVYVNPSGGDFKLVIQDADGASIYTEDNVPAQVGAADIDLNDVANESQEVAILDGLRRTEAEISSGAIPVNYSHLPGVFERYGAVGDGNVNDYNAINLALLQSAQAGGMPAKALGRRTYALGTNTLAIPDRGTLDISAASLVSENATAITFGSLSTLIAYDGATITSSGGSGAALKKTDTSAPAAFHIYGWPVLIPSVMGTAGGVGLDFTAAYKGVFEINIEGYETLVVGGSGAANDLPQTYYNELRSPRLRCTSGLTGIKLQRGCNGTMIVNPQISGASVATKAIWCPGSSGVGAGSTTVLGGYLEAFLDNASTRGVLLEDVNNFTMVGTTLESTNTTSNFAIGAIGTSTQVNFHGLGFAGGWGTSAAIMSWTSSGVFNFIGGAPTNQVCLIGLTSFPTGLLNGETRIGKVTGTGTLSVASSAAATYQGTIRNTGDGQGLLLENNSATMTAGRSVLTINRAGGPGFAIDFQDNGSAKGGIVFCTGTPESQITAVVGTLAVRNDGGANTTFYVKESGTGNTGWVAK